MKKNLLTVILLTFATVCFSQSTEFGTSENQLIYPDTTIKQLKFIVDSLNLKFRVCDLNKTYLSKFQAKANYIYLSKGKCKRAKQDIEANISYENFIKKYKRAKIEKDLMVVKNKYRSYYGGETVDFNSLELNEKYGHEFSYDADPKFDKPMKGTWIFSYSEKTDWSEESLSAFYFTEEFSQQALPVKYAKMIQYTDCMVDTNTQVFFETAHESGVRYRTEAPTNVAAFMDYVKSPLPEPKYDSDNYDEYHRQYRIWDSLLYVRMDSLKKHDDKFKTLLQAAINEVIEKGGANADFENYVGRYDSRKTELKLKRNRRVIGGCSMDQSPRYHALNIAILAAETVNWEVFLRSHLDIMNDRFDRVSDGSWAWKGRKTYIRELEVLDINVLDLLLGISLRIDNPNKNHYYGSIGRIGRALSETKEPEETEKRMLEMISDNSLDTYNRLLIYYLFLNYNYNLEDKAKQDVNKEKLKTAIKTLPEHIASKIVVE